jgi:hypothetical protein
LSVWIGGLEAFTMQSLDFTVSRSFTKLIKTSSMEVVTKRQTTFVVELPNVMFADRIYNLHRKIESIAALF